MTLPAIILAGGLGTRLGALTERLPKALIDINGRPFIHHQLELLEQNGIRDVILCVGHLGERIEEHVGNGHHLGMNVRYSWDGPALLGTGGAIRRALPLAGPAFFVLYGDSYLRCEYQRIGSSFLLTDALGLMTVYRNENKWDTSNVEFRNGRIIAYDKRVRTSRMSHIDYGLGVFRAAAFEALLQMQAFDLSAVYRTLLDDGKLAAWEVGERFYEVGSADGVRELSEALK